MNLRPSHPFLALLVLGALPTFAADLDPAQMARGKKVYTTVCAACHQPNGAGVATLFPPLAKSDYLMADKTRSIRGVIKGQSGPIVVNGKTYNGVMPPQPLKNEQIADVLTYVRNSWGNSGEAVTVAEVEAVRNEKEAPKADAPKS